jgi:hypothetical protein
MITANHFKRILGIGIGIHVLFSFYIIFFPSVLKSTILGKVYSRYLIPGPFFSDERITDTYHLLLYWKEPGSRMSQTIDPAFNNYQNFFLSGNPYLLYRSRLDNSIYQRSLFNKDSLKDREFKKAFQCYYKFHYVSQTSDSVKGVLIRIRTEDFKTSLDTLQTLEF